jgi:two-component system KDP operon response regulator KdpE
MNKDGLILIVDDEMPIRRLLIITLGANGYRTVEAATAKEALTMAAGHNPDLVILDLGLPDEDGIDVLKHLREWYSKPVLILSVRNSEEDIIQALDSGANDYLVKPFRMGELLARIRSAIRQGQTKEDSPVIDIAELAIDIANHTVKKKGELLKLTSTEFAMLALFAQNRGCVLTHQYILKEIWGHGYMEQSQYLRVFVAQLRKKIEDNPSKPALLITESGIGYRFGV